MPDAATPLVGQPPFEQYTLTGAYDEMFAPDGSVRPAYAELARRLSALSPEELQQRQRYADLTFYGLRQRIRHRTGLSLRLVAPHYHR